MSGANDNAEIRAALDNPQDAPVMAQPGDSGPDRGGQFDRPRFPLDGPVTPLGISSGLSGSQLCFYLNYNGQLVGLEAGNRHGKNSLIALYGPASDFLEEHWPQWSAPKFEGRGKDRVCVKESEIIGFDQAEASRAHIEECVRKGIFDPAGKMRGTGAHRQRGGGLVLHCGDKLLVSRHFALDGAFRDFQWIDPGPHEGFVYTAGPVIPRPHHEPAHPSCAEEVLMRLRSWNFKRPLLDPIFALGAIGGSMIGGWPLWRPNVWITGARGTGKSTLNGERGFLDELLGEGQFRTSNASAAAIRQTLQNSTVPVMFDEIEPGADNRRVSEVVELARIASSGGKQHRGGQDHQAHEFTLRSAFWFSSIDIPPLQPQDRSRLAILELLPLKADAEPPRLADWNLPLLGRKLLRRMVDGIARLEATKGKYHEALAAGGHGARACDQFGTLLACADVLLYDHDTPDQLPDDELVAEWAGRCRPDRMAEIADEVPAHVACLHHVLTSEAQARGGDERQTLGTWIGEAVAFAMEPLYEGAKQGNERAAERLQQRGLKLVNPVYHPAKGEAPARWGSKSFEHEEPGFLAVANTHQALEKVFEKTHWQGGVWGKSLARSDGAIERVKVKFGRVGANAVLVPLWLVLDDDELPNASKREACEAWLAEQLKGGKA